MVKLQAAAGNKKVAENRAKSVYDFLVKCGVNPKQLTYEGKGNAANIYENNQKANPHGDAVARRHKEFRLLRRYREWPLDRGGA